MQPVITVYEDAKLAGVAQTMLDHHVWRGAVINDLGEITGIVTEAGFAIKEAGVPFSTFRAPQLFGK